MSIRIGVDVGGTTIRVRPFPGRAEDRLVDTTDARGGGRVAARIAALVTEMIARTGMPESVGVGIPGQVDPVAGTVRHAVNLGIDGRPFPLVDFLSSRLGVTVHIENDVRTATLGAFHHLRAHRPELTSLVYVSAGTGVSAGIILDGRLHRGRHGIAGEIGHAPLGGDAIRCSCGMAGCLEAVAGGKALERRLPGGARELFRQPFPHPAEAERVATALARGLYVLAAAYDPDRLVLGGSIGLDAFPAVREVLAVMSDASPFGEVVLTPDRVTTLPPDADIGTAGAARLGSRLHEPAAPDSTFASAEEEQGGTKP